MLFNQIFTSSLKLYNLFQPRIKFCSTMVKILNVAEKNDVAKGVAGILSRGTHRMRNGKSVYNKNYEFQYTFRGRPSTMVVTSVSGHLLHLEFSVQYKSWQSCNPVDLFSAPVQKSCLDDYKPVKQNIENEIRGANVLIIWTDCDREGENIGFEVIDVCKNVKSNLEIYRAKFSEVTAPSITRAIENLDRPNKKVSDAVDVRIELDLRIGAAFTRFQTLRFQRVFPNLLSENLVSYGSCQFPTLGFVVERYKQIKDFIAEPFWKLKVLNKTDEGADTFSWERGRLFDRDACTIFYELCRENPLATVTAVYSKPKSKWRPLPLDTVEMQKLASKKLKIGAHEAMGIAERLYTKGFISYPRTETNTFPKQLNLQPLVEAQVHDPQWGAFATKVLNDGLNPRSGNKSDEAHPPIHPTKYTDTLNGNDKKLYEFIVRHFLACLSKDAQGFETTVTIEIANEKFSTSGLMITERNYLEVYPYDRWSDKSILIYRKGQTFQPTNIEMVDGSTSPPPLLTEADLIALMEKYGIGTDATHAEHIETIKKRSYVGVQDGKFLPAKLGMGLVEGYDAMGFEMSKPNLRAALESDLKKICDGQADPKAVLENQVNIYRNVFLRSVEQVGKLDEVLGSYLGEAAQPHNNFDNAARNPPRNFGDASNSTRNLQYNRGDTNQLVINPVNTTRTNLRPFADSTQNSNTSSSRSQSTSAQSNLPICNCQQHAVLLTVKKEGPNKGRKFYGCQNIGERCTFFQWETDDNENNQIYNRGDTNQLVINPVNTTRTNLRPFADSTQNSNISSSRSQSTGAQSNLPICNCQQHAVLLTVKKEGPNKGRKFYGCQNIGERCTFFQWETDDNESNQNRTQTTNRNASATTTTVQCGCGIDAKLLTVRKEGPNTGRQFYGCTKMQGQQCTFFKWADEDENQNTAMASSTHRQRNDASTTRNTDSTRKKKCGFCRQEGHTIRTCPSK